MTLTKNDIKQIGEIVDIKLDKRFTDFRGEMNDRFTDFRDEMDNRLSDFREEIATMLTQLKSDFFDRIDPILKEVPASREERTIVSEKVSDHEERLSKIEKVVNTN